MDEKSILDTINGLVDEEHRLRAAAQKGEITSDEERPDCGRWRSRSTSAGTCCGAAGRRTPTVRPTT